MKLFHMIGPCEIKANFDICITSTRVSVYYDIFEKSCLPAMPGTCATNRLCLSVWLVDYIFVETSKYLFL